MAVLKKIFLLLIIAISVSGCSDKTDILSGTPGIAEIKQFAAAQVMIETLRRQSPPDWQKISEAYETTSGITVMIDQKHSMDYDHRIREALEKCISGENVRVNQQILAKGLQHAAVLAIDEEIHMMTRQDILDDASRQERIAAYIEGIRPTFVRRDQDFFPETKQLEADLETALFALKDAEPETMIFAIRMLDDVIDRVYAFSTLYEIMEIERLRDKNLADCEVKKMEAVIFYRIISPRIRRNSSSADQLITNMITGSFDSMDSELIKENLENGLKNIRLSE